MRELTINKNILTEILDGKILKAEITKFINSLIDAELLKALPDCDFIEECVDILEELNTDDHNSLISFVDSTTNIVDNRKKVISILVACAIILTASMGAFAANYTIKKRKTESKDSASTINTTSRTASITAKTVDSSKETTKTTVKPTAKITTSKKATSTLTPITLKNIRLLFDSSFKDEYTVGEKFDTSGITVFAEFSDGKSKMINLSDCELVINEDFGKTECYETVTVKYNNASATFKVRILRDEDTKVLNSVYATFPSDFDFTVDDIENFDLDFMEVYAVYSDRSEQKLSKDEYSIEKELLHDTKTVMVTLKYKSCYTSFGLRERF